MEYHLIISQSFYRSSLRCVRQTCSLTTTSRPCEQWHPQPFVSHVNCSNWTRYPISEKDFRASYAAISSHGAHGIGATNPNDIRFLPLLFVVLAIAVRLSPEEIGGDARSRRVTSLRYYWSCVLSSMSILPACLANYTSARRSLLIAAAVQPDSLDIVLTRLLVCLSYCPSIKTYYFSQSARFLTFDRRITECWSQLGAAVRTAQALGFHRDGAAMVWNSLLSGKVFHAPNAGNGTQCG